MLRYVLTNSPATSSFMKFYPFVFSEDRRFRRMRHIVFWIGWILLMSFIYSFRSGSSLIGQSRFLGYTFLEILLETPADILYCYIVIYALFPNYLFKNKYGTFLILLFVSMISVAAAEHLVYIFLVNPLRLSYGLPVLDIGSFSDVILTMLSLNLIAGVVSTLKLLKVWQNKMEEIEDLKENKQRLQFSLIDNYVKPVFIPTFLHRIEKQAESGVAVAAMLQIMKRLSEYLIYDCSALVVELREELKHVDDFLNLERSTNPQLQLTYTLDGDVEYQQIAPFILFPLMENNFRHIDSDIENLPIDLFVSVHKQEIHLSITNYKPVETSNLLSYETETLSTIKRRLKHLYPNAHDLSIVIKSDRFIVRLFIDLSARVYEEMQVAVS